MQLQLAAVLQCFQKPRRTGRGVVVRCADTHRGMGSHRCLWCSCAAGVFGIRRDLPAPGNQAENTHDVLQSDLVAASPVVCSAVNGARSQRCRLSWAAGVSAAMN
jgi:hypothetical protein